MKLDSHQHFWNYKPLEYEWIPAESALARDWLPGDLAALQAPIGFDGSIAVQARQSVLESTWLLELADSHRQIVGVVGWANLRSEQVEEVLAILSMNPKFVGVRHVVQDEPDDAFLLQPDFLRGLRRLRQFDLTYDLLIYPRQLPAAIRLVEMLPEQPFVLDHIAKPPIRSGALSPWSAQVKELARHPNVWCKVSGMVTEANIRSWKTDDFRPYTDSILEAFGEHRVMFGSDWPVCLLGASYSECVELAERLTESLSPAGREAFWGTNCAGFYGIGPT